MNWFIATWYVVLGACIALVCVHAVVWLHRRDAWGSGTFVVLALSVIWLGFLDVARVTATTPEAFARAGWWTHWPALTASIAVVVFMRQHLKAGAAWLGWSVVGVRAVSFVINAFSELNLNQLAIDHLFPITFLGVEFVHSQGTPNPWRYLGQASLALLAIFVAHGSLQLWQRGERRRAVVIGASLFLLVFASMTMAVLAFSKTSQVPLIVFLAFIPMLAGMSYELSRDIVNATRLATELDLRTTQLERSREQVELAADASSSGLWRVDVETGRLWATPRMLEMLGLAPDRQHHVEDALARVHPEDREGIRALMRDRTLQGRRVWGEYRAIAPDGSVRWHSGVGRLHGDGDRVPLALMGASIDITERRRAADERAAQRAALEQLSRAATLSEMSAALAHELNRPLAVVLANAEAALKQLDRPDADLAEVRAMLEDIVTADERASEVIRRLRALLGRGSPRQQPESIAAIVQGVLDLAKGDLARDGVVVETAFEDPLPAVPVDRITIEQVLLNLVGNARDAMRANVPGDRCLHIAASRRDDALVLRVTDRGQGLPTPPDQVFAPFFTTKANGLGMGLAISRSIARAHGGELRAEHATARGATFVLTLPLAQPEAPGQLRGTPSAGTGGDAEALDTPALRSVA